MSSPALKTDLPLQPVILAGGSGTRLWPLSRVQYPKPFIPLIEGASLFEATVARVKSLPGARGPLVVCNEAQRFLVAEQLRKAGCGADVSILLEPFCRNTAPAIALAALEVLSRGQDALLLVLPADHYMPDKPAFTDAVDAARAPASAGAFVTFGIVPVFAETGFGYIHIGSAEDHEAGLAERDAVNGSLNVHSVLEFVEKPNAERAAQYVSSGEYYWNSGMFMFRASSYMEVLHRYAPKLAQASTEAHHRARRELDFIRADAQAFSEAPDISVDYAVMEPLSRAGPRHDSPSATPGVPAASAMTAASAVDVTEPAVLMVPFSGAWSDVGSWAALQGLYPKDAEGNVIQGDVLSIDNSDCYLRSEGRLLAAVGLENLMVVETADATLVAHRDRAQDVRNFARMLADQGRSEHLSHTRVLRPWGSYESLAMDGRFQVKRIVVMPGQRLSLQMHHHRAEHWVVVRGTARVTRGDETLLLTEDQSTYIPLGTVHRLENPGSIPLEIIEVQSGSYLGEDDIVRLEDHYGRQ